MFRHAVSAVVLVAAVAAAVSSGAGASSASSKSDGLTHPLVGAYYYLWNPENLIAGGSLRSQLAPPQTPPSGLIDSNRTPTATRDIANAHKAGINFFAIDWWPYDPAFSGRNYLTADAAMKEFLAAPDLREMKFAMFYETWNLGFDAPVSRRPFPGRRSCISTRTCWRWPSTTSPIRRTCTSRGGRSSTST
jgi:hypothetical protein